MTDIALVACDIDGTVTASKQPITTDMADTLVHLSHYVDVCLISGASFEQIRHQVLDHLVICPHHAKRFHLMPTCGTSYYVYRDNTWRRVYDQPLSPQQVARAITAVEQVARQMQVWHTDTWGPAIDNRGTQITYSALGQDAPLDAKKSWDPTGAKRDRLAAAVGHRLPDMEVRRGGSTSIDITQRGVDKAYGINKLIEVTSVDPDRIVFFGDSLMVGGNDYPVTTTGVQTVAVRDWHQTHHHLHTLIQHFQHEADMPKTRQHWRPPH